MAWAILLAFSFLAACEDNDARIYSARLFREDVGCLESYAPVALVHADQLRATCEPTCLLQGQLYVSTVCPPYPEGFTLPAADDPECARALAALAQELSCDLPAGEEPADAGEPPDTE